MIGNDVIDLKLASIESNWQRKGFLKKLFSTGEQELINASDNPEIAIWNMWSRKEAAYKIYNRCSGIRVFNPTKFQCSGLNSFDTVSFGATVIYVKTEILPDRISTLAATGKTDWERIINCNQSEIYKIKSLPFYLNRDKNCFFNATVSHHGRFTECFYLEHNASITFGR